MSKFHELPEIYDLTDNLAMMLKTAPFVLGNQIRGFVWRVAYYSEPKLNQFALLPNVTFHRRGGVGGGRSSLAYIYNKSALRTSFCQTDNTSNYSSNTRFYVCI